MEKHRSFCINKVSRITSQEAQTHKNVSRIIVVSHVVEDGMSCTGLQDRRRDEGGNRSTAILVDQSAQLEWDGCKHGL